MYKNCWVIYSSAGRRRAFQPDEKAEFVMIVPRLNTTSFPRHSDERSEDIRVRRFERVVREPLNQLNALNSSAEQYCAVIYTCLHGNSVVKDVVCSSRTLHTGQRTHAHRAIKTIGRTHLPLFRRRFGVYELVWIRIYKKKKKTIGAVFRNRLLVSIETCVVVRRRPLCRTSGDVF